MEVHSFNNSFNNLRELLNSAYNLEAYYEGAQLWRKNIESDNFDDILLEIAQDTPKHRSMVEKIASKLGIELVDKIPEVAPKKEKQRIKHT